MRRKPVASSLIYGAVAVSALALASRAEIPMEPVPFTLQTLVVILVGFLLGPVLGFAATAAWLIAGALGLPVFSGGSGGADVFGGPTAGYLLSFPFAAALAGWLSKTWASALHLFGAAIAAHVLILAAGGAWLATQIGAAAALEKGIWPFIPSALIKSVAAVAIIKAITLASRTNPQARSR